MDSIGDRFQDAVAFARSVVRDDWVALETIYGSVDDPLDLLIPQAWMLCAVVQKVSILTGQSVDEVWITMLESIQSVEDGQDDL